jgi:phytoene dehydrogenase-like protein
VNVRAKTECVRGEIRPREGCIPLPELDAVVVGAGPNGLSAAIELARCGQRVLVREAAEVVGGGTRTAQLTLPDFLHDVCSAIHPLGAGSPFFNQLPLAAHGLEWIHPPVALAHPFDDGSAAVLDRSIDATVDSLDRSDDDAYRSLIGPVVAGWDRIVGDALRPLRLPAHPITMARFGLRALRSASGLARSRLNGPRARALFAGIAAHAMMPLERIPTAAIGIVLAAAAHAVGWPLPRGGSQRIADALAGYLSELGGEIEAGAEVSSLDQLPGARAVLLNLTPRQVLRVAGERLPARYRRALARYRYGLGAYKVDWALAAPIPWAAPECRLAGTVHLGASAEEIGLAERQAWAGDPPSVPFVLLTQPSLFDPTRAPPGRHTAWAYCHVPNGSVVDMSRAIEDQVERFAPGFRERILARSSRGPAALEQYNANLVGGDINGGVQDLGQLFFRPVASLNPYATPVSGLYICSASTPPGGGVHGLCGYFAARAALMHL